MIKRILDKLARALHLEPLELMQQTALYSELI